MISLNSAVQRWQPTKPDTGPFKVLQSAPCCSIGSSCAEKTSKMCQNIGNCQKSRFSMVFGLFLGWHWSDWAQTFFTESGISRHKFRVPTRGTLEHIKMSIFFTLTPLEGTLGKIFLTRKLHFRYSIVIEHQIKHLAKLFSTKRGEWHTLCTHLQSFFSK